MHVLRNYVADAGRLQDPNIIFVLRGFVGGARYVKPTKTFVSDLLKRAPDCDVAAGKCEALEVSLQIDPALFARYGISEVPAFVYVPNIQILDFDRSEGESDSAKVGTYIAVKGDMPLETVLEKLQAVTGSRSLSLGFDGIFDPVSSTNHPHGSPPGAGPPPTCLGGLPLPSRGWS